MAKPRKSRIARLGPTADAIREVGAARRSKLKGKQPRTTKQRIADILQEVHDTLADHQGCAMTLELTQALMRSCKEAGRLLVDV